MFLPCKDTQFSVMDSLLQLFIFYLLFSVVNNIAFLGSTWNNFCKCSCWRRFAAGGMLPECDTAQFLYCHFKDFILSSISSYKGILFINDKEANTSWSSCKILLVIIC